MWANECNNAQSTLLSIIKPYNFLLSPEKLCLGMGELTRQILYLSFISLHDVPITEEKNDGKGSLWAR